MRWWVVAIVIACFYLLPKDHHWSLTFDLIAIAVVLPACILWAAGSVPAIPAVAGWSGRLSYPLYILHVPLSELIGDGFARYGIEPGPVSGAAAVLVVLAAAWVALVVYDQPLGTRLRRRFGSRRHRTAAGTAA